MTALITQPELDPQSNGRALDEIFFEDYGFNAIYRTNNSSIVAERYQQAMKVEGCVIVESGHRSGSFMLNFDQKIGTKMAFILGVSSKLLSKSVLWCLRS